MSGETMPKYILKKVNKKRAEQGLGPFEDEEKKRKKRESKPSVDVGEREPTHT
jgi:hypothetical protein